MKIRDARFIASAMALTELPPPAFAEIAFAGRSNVGKSSLINALVERRKLVRTSGTPGCTRGIQIFRVALAEPEAVLDLVDLPGYGYAKRSKAERKSWGQLVESFFGTRAGLRAVVVIVDLRRGLQEDDLQLVDFLAHTELRPILVATKSDKVPSSQRKVRLAALGRQTGARVLGFSATKGSGRQALWQALLDAACVGTQDSSASAPNVTPMPHSTPTTTAATRKRRL